MEERNAPVEFIPWQTEHPWAEFRPDTDTPGPPCEQLDVLTDGRGNEAAVIQIANLLPRNIDVRVWVDALVDAEGNAVSGEHLILREVTWVPSHSGDMGADAIPRLNEAGLLTLAASSSSRLWIDVETGDLPPGTYATTLRFRALTARGATWDVPLAWKVADVALPEAMPVHFCNWGYVWSNPQMRLMQDAAIHDMQTHHTSVFVLTGEKVPKVLYDSSGKLVGDVDWSGLDWMIDRMRPTDFFLIHSPGIAPKEGVPGPLSEPWTKALQLFLPELVKHLAERGFGYERWAFYPIDEPGLLGGKLVYLLEDYARTYKQIDPNVQVYTDPFKGMTVADMERSLDLLDIYQMNLTAVLTEPSRERPDFLADKGKLLWVYEAGGNVKSMVGIEYYWKLIWLAWEFNLTGVGYWSHSTRQPDLWQGPNPNNNDWEMVYAGADVPVPSVRWQAIRIGIEDYVRLWRLRACARSSDAEGSGRETLRRIDEIVAEAHDCRWDPTVVARYRRELIERAQYLQ